MPAKRATAAPGAAKRRNPTTEPPPALGVAVRRKFGNVPQTVDGMRFDSKREATRYANLLIEEQIGTIRDLECHPRFPLVVHGQDCGTYVADFAYVVGLTGERVVEDVKSPSTAALPTYRLKRRLLWALYGLTVREVR